VAILVCHVLFRVDLRTSHQWRSPVVEVLYAAGLLLLMAAAIQELWYHGDLNLPEDSDRLFFTRHITLVFPGFLLLLVARPICPRGHLSSGLAMVIALLGSLGTAVAFANVHKSDYAIFFNGDFIRAVFLVATLFAGAWLLRLTELKEQQRGFVPPVALAMTALGLLWILLTQEIWYFWRCLDRYRTPTANWQFIAHMCLSITWAIYAITLMVAGFWKRVRLLRYAALGLFVLLLGKIFIVDTRNVSSLYRIAGFLATGIALVGVSYLYQYLKKQGFFEGVLAPEEKNVQ
jgi:uncharacterized membrane protein